MPGGSWGQGLAGFGHPVVDMLEGGEIGSLGLLGEAPPEVSPVERRSWLEVMEPLESFLPGLGLGMAKRVLDQLQVGVGAGSCGAVGAVLTGVVAFQGRGALLMGFEEE